MSNAPASLRRQRVLDPLTGELHDAVLLDKAETRQPKRRFSDPYAITFLPGLAELAVNNTLTRSDWRVLCAIACRATMDGTPWRTEAQMIGDTLGIKVPNVHASIRRLIEAGVLTRPRQGFIAFTGRYFWRGPSVIRESVKAGGALFAAEIEEDAE